MKIALLTDVFPPGGVGGDAAIVQNLARGYHAKGHEVLVIAATNQVREVGKREEADYAVEWVFSEYHPRWQSWLGLWNPGAIRAIKSLLREFKPDVVHAHSITRYLSLYSLVCAKKTGARVFLTAHDAMLYHYGKAIDESKVSSWSLLSNYRKSYNPFKNFILRRILRSVDGIFSVSESLARALRNNGIHVTAAIHNGIDVREWQVEEPEIERFKKIRGLGSHVILFGGRLSGLKGAFTALEAIPFIAKSIPDVQLLVMGTKNMIAKRMELEAEKLGVERNVVFAGHISGNELRCAYHAASVVVVLSRYLDPFPTINLEAQACGKPVVTTNMGGSKEVIVDGKTGYIVDPSDTHQIANKVIQLLENRELADKFGSAGKERVENDFTLDGQAVAYLKFFADVSLPR